MNSFSTFHLLVIFSLIFCLHHQESAAQRSAWNQYNSRRNNYNYQQNFQHRRPFSNLGIRNNGFSSYNHRPFSSFNGVARPSIPFRNYPNPLNSYTTTTKYQRRPIQGQFVQHSSINSQNGFTIKKQSSTKVVKKTEKEKEVLYPEHLTGTSFTNQKGTVIINDFSETYGAPTHDTIKTPTKIINNPSLSKLLSQKNNHKQATPTSSPWTVFTGKPNTWVVSTTRKPTWPTTTTTTTSSPTVWGSHTTVAPTTSWPVKLSTIPAPAESFQQHHFVNHEVHQDSEVAPVGQAEHLIVPTFNTNAINPAFTRPVKLSTNPEPVESFQEHHFVNHEVHQDSDVSPAKQAEHLIVPEFSTTKKAPEFNVNQVIKPVFDPLTILADNGSSSSDKGSCPSGSTCLWWDKCRMMEGSFQGMCGGTFQVCCDISGNKATKVDLTTTITTTAPATLAPVVIPGDYPKAGISGYNLPNEDEQSNQGVVSKKPIENKVDIRSLIKPNGGVQFKPTHSHRGFIQKVSKGGVQFRPTQSGTGFRPAGSHQTNGGVQFRPTTHSGSGQQINGGVQFRPITHSGSGQHINGEVQFKPTAHSGPGQHINSGVQFKPTVHIGSGQNNNGGVQFRPTAHSGFGQKVNSGIQFKPVNSLWGYSVTKSPSHSGLILKVTGNNQFRPVSTNGGVQFKPENGSTEKIPEGGVQFKPAASENPENPFRVNQPKNSGNLGTKQDGSGKPQYSVQSRGKPFVNQYKWPKTNPQPYSVGSNDNSIPSNNVFYNMTYINGTTVDKQIQVQFKTVAAKVPDHTNASRSIDGNSKVTFPDHNIKSQPDHIYTAQNISDYTTDHSHDFIIPRTTVFIIPHAPDVEIKASSNIGRIPNRKGIRSRKVEDQSDADDQDRVRPLDADAMAKLEAAAKKFYAEKVSQSRIISESTADTKISKIKEQINIVNGKTNILPKWKIRHSPNCAASTKCVPKSHCNLQGSISEAQLNLSGFDRKFKGVPLSTCLPIGMRFPDEPMVCCRQN